MKKNKQTHFLKCFNNYVNYLFFLVISIQAYAQGGGMQFTPGTQIACPLGTEDEHSRHGMDFDKEALLGKEPTAEFIVKFGNGFENNLEAREAFQLVTDIWARELVSSVPIRISVAFGVFSNIGVIASAGSVYDVSGFPNAPNTSLAYPAALANAIAGEILQPQAEAEINITFGSGINFYFGTDGNTPSQQIDFVTIALHEIGHGLGFSARTNLEDGAGSFTDFTASPAIYTNFITNNEDLKALELRNSPIELGNLFVSGQVFFSGENATVANSNEHPPLFAPSLFSAGSSISHWDEDTYPPGDPNSLMTAITGRSESNFNVGNITRGLLKDLGWELNNSKLFPIVISEVTGSVEVVLGDTATQNFTIKNISNKPLNYTVAITNNVQSSQFSIINGDNVTLQPNEEKIVTISFDSNDVGSGLFTVATNVSTTVSDLIKSQELNFVVLDGTESAIINTIDSLEENFAVVNSLDNSFRITNDGNRVLDYTITIENDEFSILSISELEGNLIPNDFSVVEYSINREGIAAGTYTSEIVITSNAENKPNLRIPVTIIVRDTLSPPSFDISISSGLNVDIEVDKTTDIDNATVIFEISNSGEQPLIFSLLDSETALVRTSINSEISTTLNPGAKVVRTLNIIPGIDAVETSLSSQVVFTSNDPSLPELRIPLEITLSRERGRLVEINNSNQNSNIVEEGTSVTTVRQFVNTGLAPINVSDIVSETSNLIIEDWSSASGDALVDVGEILKIETRLENLRRTATNFNFNSIRIVSDATPNNFFNNRYDSPLSIVEASGIVASELLINNEINLNSLSDTTNLVRTQTVEITNVENNPITYSIDINNNTDNIFSIDETSGVLSPNETKIITVTTDATSLNLGEFVAQIVIKSTNSEVLETVINTRLSIINSQGFLVLDPSVSFVDFFDNFVGGSAGFQNNSRVPVEITNIEVLGNVPFQELFGFSDSGEEFPSELLVVQPGEFVFLDYFYIPATTDQGAIIVNSNALNSELLIPVEFEFPEDLEPVVLGFQLVDVITNEVVETFFEGTTVDLASYDNPVTLVALTGAANPESVVFDYRENLDFTVDNEAPFSIGSNFGNKLFPFNFSLGEQIITAKPFSEINGEGTEFSGVTFNFNFIDSRLPFVTDFVLVNAITNEIIKPILEGEILDLNSFDTRAFNIAAILDKPSKSIEFNINGKRRFDLFAPFSLGGDFKGDFRNLNLTGGENTLTAFSKSIVLNRGFVSGNPNTINFTVIPLEPTEIVASNDGNISFQVEPNPVKDNAVFRVNSSPESQFDVRLTNLINQPMNAVNRVTIDNKGNGTLNLAGLISGYYYLRIIDRSNGTIFRSKIIKE